MGKIPIRLTNKDVRTRIEYVQGTNSIPIILQVVDWEIPEGSEARIYVRKPSGKEVYNSAEVSGNEVAIQPTTQMFAEFGRQLGQVQIANGDDIAATFLLEFEIEKNLAFESTAVESSDEYGILDDLIKQAQTAISDTQAATTQAKAATSAANNATKTANKAANGADTAATAANNAAEELQEKVNAGDFTASVTVGTVTTGNPGTQASVVNSGTDKDAVFDFTIPRGDTGTVENLSEQPITFTEAATNDKIATGESLSTLFGKTARLFTRVGTAETDITDIQSDISISEETIAAFEALGWTPPVGGAVIESLLDWISEHADFYKEKGTSGNWIWKEDTGGNIEAYADISNNVNINAGNAPVYYNSTEDKIAIPSFIDADYVSILWKNGGGGFIFPYARIVGQNVQVTYFRFYGGPANRTMRYRLKIKGTRKT